MEKELNNKIELGEINTLKIERVSEPGFYLMAEDEETVLLPNAYIKADMNIGDLIDVFIYTDSEDRLVATTEKPYLLKNEYASLEVVDVTDFGAFVNIGLKKDILVPRNKQKSSYHIGGTKVLRLIEDDKTKRLIASEKFTGYFSKDLSALNKNDEVDLILYSKTPLGFKVIANNLYDGMIFHNEIFQNIKIGDKCKGYIKNVRDDGKLDISLQKIGQKKGDDNSSKILELLEKNNGVLNFTYKSSPEIIKSVFGLSKKAYKSALTKLLDEKIKNTRRKQ